MSERGLYRKGFDLDSEDSYVINRNKKIRASKKKSDHRHTYTKVIIECEDKKLSFFSESRRVAYIVNICLQCGRVQNLEVAEIKKYDDFFKRDLLVLTLDPDEVEKAYPDLPVYTAVQGKHWNNFTDIKLKESNTGDQK